MAKRVSYRELRTALEDKLLGEKAVPKTLTPKKLTPKTKKKLNIQHGLSQKELWRLRKMIQRLYPITRRTKSQRSGKKGKLQRHHKDGNIKNVKKDNIQIVTEPEHIKIHKEAGTYSDAGKVKPTK